MHQPEPFHPGPVGPRSQARARAAQGAPLVSAFFALFAAPMFYSAWTTPLMHIAARIGFTAFAALLAWSSVRRLWAWAAGGEARLSLSRDPVPHGQEVHVKFSLDREVQGRSWSVKVILLGPADDGSGFGTTWSETFAAQPTGRCEVSSTVFIPAHLPPTAAVDRANPQAATLMLRSGPHDWMFRLETIQPST